jgi:hypothetical protein
MKLKEWLERNNLTMYMIAQMAGVSRGTIKNLILGRPARSGTAKKIIRATLSMKDPIKKEMFDKILRD